MQKARHPLPAATIRKFLALERAIKEKRPYRYRLFTGFAYLIGYDSGITKVGSTSNPKQRFQAIRRQATSHGQRIVDARLSFIHESYLDTERQLIAFCRAHGVSAGGREYFRIPFGQVATFADSEIKYFDIPAYEAAYERMTERLAQMTESIRIMRIGAAGDDSMPAVEAYQRGLAIEAAQVAATDPSP